ncbi:hypothetical protein ACFL4G_03165 [Thermodesulfobacteriota bacterium]
MQPFRILKCAILAGLLMLLPSCGSLLSRGETQGAPRERRIHDPRIESIASDVELIRGLRFRGRIRCASMEPWEIRELLINRMRQQTDIRSILAMERAYKKLGLLDGGASVPASMEALLSAKVKGLYDSEAGVLYVTAAALVPPPPSDLHPPAPVVGAAMSDFLVAHELTHALQDRHFGLDGLTGRASNDDMCLAVKALIEGDAIRTGIALIEKRFGDRVAGTNLLEESVRERLTPGSAKHGEIPEFLTLSVSFPYVHGTAFVEAVEAVGGWKAVDRLYRDPPMSTEQILHPERFLKSADPPVPVSPPDLGSVLGDRWQRTWTGVLGELNTRILLGRYLDISEAMESASGWSGDRLSAYENEAGSMVLAAWITRWDSEADGWDFFNSWLKLVERRYGEALERAEITEKVALFETGEDLILVERRGADVVVLAGVPSRLAGAILAHLWEGLDK